MKKIFFTLTAAAMLGGCASSYQHSEVQTPSAMLDPAVGVLIAMPENGQYGETTYQHSGRMTAEAVRKAFSRHAQRVDIADDCRGAKCLEQAQAEGYGYFVDPTILHWEDRATEWSGKPDRIEIELKLYGVNKAEEIASYVYSGKSKWLTMGGDHPQDLLHDPTNEYILSLYN